MSDFAARVRPLPVLRAAPVIFAAIGLALGGWLIGQAGLADVWRAATSVGWLGFLLVGVAQAGLFVLLGAAWSSVLPAGRLRRLPLLIWGRAVRDSAAQVLPFSPLGGFVAGARAVTLHGMAWPMAAASTCTDVTVEFLAELGFVLFGLVTLLRLAPESGLIMPLSVGLAVALLAGGAALVLQRGVGPLLRGLGARIAGPWFSQMSGPADRMQAAIDQVHRHPARLVLGFLLHLGGWFATACTTWLSFHLIGGALSLPKVVALEAVLQSTLTLGFMVPAALGVQELAYAGLGALFGCPPELGIAVSLIRRARDLAIGVPVLLAWQVREARALRGAGSGRRWPTTSG